MSVPSVSDNSHYEQACDQAIAMCDGNMRSTIKALIMWTFAVLSDTSARSGLRARLFAGPLLYQNSYPIN